MTLTTSHNFSIKRRFSRLRSLTAWGRFLAVRTHAPSPAWAWKIERIVRRGRSLPVSGCFLALCSCAMPTPDTELIDPSMRSIQGATFRMGSDLAELESIQELARLTFREPLLPETPSHDITVGDFQMDVHLVSNGDFAAFVTSNPQWSKAQADTSFHNGRYLEHWPGGELPSQLSDHPVIFVSWQAAVAYCQWRGKRLPTEAEFEWAAQDGSTRSEFPWGSAYPDDSLVNWGGNGIDTTVPVGSYPANARGLYDMAGNVWQFTADPWLGSHGETLAAADRVSRAAEDPSIRRVVRGGSWGASAANLRVRYRDSHRPFDAREMVGFRCAR